ncbi:hypothetical protein [Paenibacillus sp. HB172176]|uniref:hypothetical protein n=1 Tax=Paenibacillus sp. HB172176 TaxID=2493690 RepID=UPI00143C672A|nr:hypothetical protein [Paenibacillus sp. HB172176]
MGRVESLGLPRSEPAVGAPPIGGFLRWQVFGACADVKSNTGEQKSEVGGAVGVKSNSAEWESRHGACADVKSNTGEQKSEVGGAAGVKSNSAEWESRRGACADVKSNTGEQKSEVGGAVGVKSNSESGKAGVERVQM